MRGYLFILILVLCVSGNLVRLAPAHSRNEPDFHAQEPTAQRGSLPLVIDCQGNHLSVSLQNAPWTAVLEELERCTGIPIRVEGSLTGTVTQAFGNLPLKEGLQRLFRNINVVFFHRPMAIAETGAGSLTRVLLFPRNTSTGGDHTQLTPLEQTRERTEPEGEVVAAESTARHLRILQDFAQQGNTIALREALSDPDPVIQVAAFKLLAEYDPQEAIAALPKAAKSKEAQLRLQALRRLQQTSGVDRATVLAALGEALADENTFVKIYAIQALTDQGDPDALTYLGQASRDTNPSIQMLAIESIVQMDHGLTLLLGGGRAVK
jgi:HEAT repeats